MTRLGQTVYSQPAGARTVWSTDRDAKTITGRGDTTNLGGPWIPWVPISPRLQRFSVSQMEDTLHVRRACSRQASEPVLCQGNLSAKYLMPRPGFVIGYSRLIERYTDLQQK
ncbi:hypothetical protein RRG08_014669 [Elysia crispata]|uniref:Uncharacterized protein n=1 Tax=Elysia crispata TaxID=231223 RepID=A0AAE1CYV4_9GAST|nr:hypothetical protein RRG08_014669 [Elysia crispata]